MRVLRGAIVTRLTVGLGLVAGTVFFSTAAFLHISLTLRLEQHDRIKLGDKTHAVLHIVEEANATGDRDSLFHHLDDLQLGHNGLHVWIVAATGAILYGRGAPPVRSGAEDFMLSGQRKVDILSLPLPRSGMWAGSILRVAQETHARETMLRQHLYTLLLACGTAVAIIVALSWYVASRCLEPVKRLSREARSITPKDLGRRMSVPPEESELRGLVLSFNALLDRLEASHEQLRSFSANVAHELRTPLASLITGTQILLAADRSPEDTREALSSNLEELQLLNDLVNDMLFLAKADQGDRAEGIEYVDLGAEVDKVLHFCEALLHENNLTAKRSGTASLSCNPPLLRRALLNLITNAVQHTLAGQTVQVSIEGEGDTIRLGVLNPGPEIPEDVRERMFERFYRADISRSRQRTGHGLGLAIVAAIARMHGGTTFVERAGSHNHVGIVFPHQPPSFSQRECAATSSGNC
jgi:two-component system, OmpR family, heavy metal sensor histidine kinase CusS